MFSLEGILFIVLYVLGLLMTNAFFKSDSSIRLSIGRNCDDSKQMVSV